MKKLVFMFVAMAAISFASCGGNNANGAANDSDSTKGDSINNVEGSVSVEENGDSLSSDSSNVANANDSVK